MKYHTCVAFAVYTGCIYDEKVKASFVIDLFCIDCV